MRGGNAADPGGWNKYAYVGGDPVNFNDPSGLAKCNVVGTYTNYGLDGWQSAADVQCMSAGGTLFTFFSASVSPLPPGPLSKSDWDRLNNSFEGTAGAELDQIEWDRTAGALQATANFIARGMVFSEDCLAAISSIQEPGTDRAPTVAGIQVAARNARFRNGLTTTDTDVRATFDIPGRYATAITPGDVIYWRPGSEVARGEAWLGGAVMHELLHNMGFNHAEMYMGLNLAAGIVNPDISDVISQELGVRCFGGRR